MPVNNLMPGEADEMARIAGKIFNDLNIKAEQNLTLREVFITGFLFGRVHTLRDIGILDDANDDEKIYRFLQERDL